MEKTIRDLAGLEEEASSFVAGLTPRQDGATLVTLSGELGAGKTAFTKAVAAALGITETVTSPTFVLEKIYLLPTEPDRATRKFERLIHIDAYRLDEGSELIALGFDALVHDSKNLILLEWPEKVSSALPVPAVRLSFVVREDGSRVMTYAQ